MSGIQRKGKRESTAKKKVEMHELKSAYIIPAAAGQQIINGLAELPIKYSQSIGPMIDILQKAFRGDITVKVNPDKLPTRPPAEPKADMKVEKPEK